jgi:16S rRNA (cytidine1402-2'-O)-methyltransferase
MADPSDTRDLPDGGEPIEDAAPSPSLEPGLYVVSTPIGNLRDMTFRAVDVLRGADLVLAEDTRVARKLLDAYGVGVRPTAYHEHNAVEAGARALAALEAGQRVALISDAGTPLVSDPGSRLVRAAIAAGRKVIPIPGASAPLAALVGAGLPPDRFLFVGFLPPKAGARRQELARLATIPATLVFFETGPRLAESLADMAAVFGPRPAVVARELTKLFEEFRRADLLGLAASYRDHPPKGEIVILVGPPDAAVPAGPDAIDAALRDALSRLSVKDAASEVADMLGVPRRDAYARALALKSEG